MTKNSKKTSISTVPWGGFDVLVVLALAFFIPIVIYAFVYLLSQTSLLPKVWTDVIFEDGRPFVEALWYLVSVCAELVLLAAVLRKYKISWTALGLRKFNWLKSAGWIAVSYFGFVLVLAFIFMIIEVIWPQANLDQAQVTGFENATGALGMIISFSILVVIAPFVEELFYRGFVFPALYKKAGFVLAALGSSMLFGLMHAQLNIGIYTAILGLFLCFLYYRLASVIPGIVLHMVNNFLAFVVIFKVHL